MRKTAILVSLFVLAAVSVTLAAAPKPMACDSWKCGPKCAPAKYVAVRFPPTIRPLFESQIYGAAVLEGAVSVAVLLGARWSGRRRAAEAARREFTAGVPKGGEA